ncbi:hypothetical protein FRB94_013630 [Tulasnella sp. JGI-2019a]|nr:hypothetical protein FRB93_007649 [Tulasnella sp. JGI-2019a]KAG9008270.1 hypothetical protein FRB94_013630 [Tulasnella sp. JGI-2019a]KAG9026878.1 hypothetical protein FRB95_008364 [Tulasnella sp. JGI-2019a]
MSFLHSIFKYIRSFFYEETSDSGLGYGTARTESEGREQRQQPRPTDLEAGLGHGSVHSYSARIQQENRPSTTPVWQPRHRPPPTLQPLSQHRPSLTITLAEQVCQQLSYSGDEEDSRIEDLSEPIDDGHAVSQDDSRYTELRAKANVEGDAMVRCFKDSQNAFTSGDRARAKDLSNQGRIHKAEMERLHSEACELIFQINNEGRGRGPNEVDLHGLYVKEAIQEAQQAIIGAQMRDDRQIRFIVGKGLHSQGDPRLKPAIEELAVQHDLVAALDPRNSGVLIITLREGEGEPAVSPRVQQRKPKGAHSQRRVSQSQSAAHEVSSSFGRTPSSPRERREALGQYGHGTDFMAPRLEVEIY